MNMKFVLMLALVLAMVTAVSVHADFSIPIVDAHNQLGPDNSYEKIFDRMNLAGVSRILLAADSDSPESWLLSFAAEHPGRISPLLRTKGPKATLADINPSKSTSDFVGLEEIIVWHAQKKHAHARQMHFGFNTDVRRMIHVAIAKSWPCIIHIEFRKTDEYRDELMAKLKELLAQNRSTPFLLIHVGQLSAPEISRLIDEHSNIGFLLSHTTPYYQRQQPFTNFFPDGKLSKEWRALLIAHPDRFVAAFDAAHAPAWNKQYVRDVLRWRRTLEKLPSEVAHAIGHGNAEKLWHLPPTLLRQPAANDADNEEEAGEDSDDDSGA